jgi:hypothetical protein
MKPVIPEFVVPGPPPRWLWWACAAVAAAAAAALLAAWHAHTQVRQTQSQLAAARAAVPLPTLAVALPPPPYADSAREFLDERSPEWQATLLALERNGLIGVTPVSVEVQPRERTARVEVEFADYAVLMRYLDQLNAGTGSGIAEWSLVSAQQSGQAGAPGASTAVLLRRW